MPKVLSYFSIPYHDNTALLSELKNIGEFTYIPNPGNMGDALIAAATLEFFDENGLKYNIYDGTTLDSIVYGGGGLWSYDYENYYVTLFELFKNAKRIVILPSSFNKCTKLIDFIDERFVIFCREKKSYDYMLAANTKAKIILDHDMAFRLTDKNLFQNFLAPSMDSAQSAYNVHHILQKTRHVSYFNRLDCESYGHYPTDIDLSAFLNISIRTNRNHIMFCKQQIMSAVDCTDVIITDRLHVAIAGAFAGKEIYMLDNTYGKLSAVYDHSMKDIPNVHLCDSIPSSSRISSFKTSHKIYKNLKRFISENKSPIKHRQPFVSVIIPIYNVEKYLDQCVQSVLKQTLSNIEIILVDDASPDNCPQMCDEYATQDNRVRVIHQTNRGLGGARNAGLDIANGAYIYFLDSDDWLAENALETLYGQARQTKTQLVLTGETLWMEDSQQFAPGWRDYSKKKHPAYLCAYNMAKTFTPAWGRLYKASFIKKHGLKFVEKCFFEDNSWGEFMILLGGRVSFVPSVVFYRRRSSSITGQADLRGLDMVKDLNFFNDFVRARNIRGLKVKLCYIWQLSRMVGYMYDLPLEMRDMYWNGIRDSISKMNIPLWYLWYVCRTNGFSYSKFRMFVQRSKTNKEYNWAV